MVTLNTKSTKMGGSSDGIEHGHGVCVHRLDYSKHYSRSAYLQENQDNFLKPQSQWLLRRSNYRERLGTSLFGSFL